MIKKTHLFAFLFSFITTTCSLVCMELSTNTYPITLCPPNYQIKLITQKQRPPQTYDELITTHENITILKTEQAHERFDKCFTVALTEHLGITGQAPEKLKISHTDDLIEYLDIINNYYEPIKRPEVNSLVTYINRKQKITHFAVVTSIDTSNHVRHEQVRAKSKWGMFPELIEHGLFDVPLSYGRHVRFYNIKPDYQNNKELLLTTVQTAISSCKEIQEELQSNKNILIALAQGENVFLADDDEIFNNSYTLLQKTTFLLKTCMGLDINSHTQTNQHTVLMLATKRNDIEMMKLFLAMGADPHKKNIHGKTPLIVAQALNFYDAVEILKQHGASY